MKPFPALARATFLASCLSASSAFAAPPVDNFGVPFTVTNAAGAQVAPAVAYSPGCDRFLVVWQDKRNGVDDDIWGTYVDGAGGGVLGTFNLTPGRAGNQRAPAIAYEPQFHTFLVVWMDDISGNWDIYGRNYDCQKASVGPLIAISTGAALQQYPDVDCAYGLAWVVWHDARNGNLDVYGQRVNPGGALLGGNLRVSELLASEQSYPAIAMNPRPDTGCSLYSFLTAWRDMRAGNFDVLGHQLCDLGLCGPAMDLPLYVGPSSQTLPDLVYGSAALVGNDRYLVAWQDLRTGNLDVFGRMIFPDGTPATASFPIASVNAEQKLPSVTYSLADRQFLCVYQDSSAGNADISARRVDLTGALVGGAITIASAAAAETTPAASWSSSSDRYLVVYESGANLYARAYWP